MDIVLITPAPNESGSAARHASLARELNRHGASARILVAGADELALRRLRREAPGLSIRTDSDDELAGADLVVADFSLGGARLAALGAARGPGTRLLARVPGLAVDRDATGGILGFDGALAGTPLVRDFLVVRRRVAAAWSFPEWADRISPAAVSAADLAPVVVGGAFSETNAGEAEDLLLGLAAERNDLVVTLPVPPALRTRLEAAGVTLEPPPPPKRLRELLFGASAALFVPDRPYAGARSSASSPFPFEAIAAGVPLLSLPWEEPEHPLAAGRDFLSVEDSTEALEALRHLAADPSRARSLTSAGRSAAARHTAGRRAERLIAIAAGLGIEFPEDRAETAPRLGAGF